MAVVIHTGGHILSDITVGCGLCVLLLILTRSSFVNISCAGVGVAFGHPTVSPRLQIACAHFMFLIRSHFRKRQFPQHTWKKGEERRNIREVYYRTFAGYSGDKVKLQ